MMLKDNTRETLISYMQASFITDVQNCYKLHIDHFYFTILIQKYKPYEHNIIIYTTPNMLAIL
jgi:hypothetical protein